MLQRRSLLPAKTPVGAQTEVDGLRSDGSSSSDTGRVRSPLLMRWLVFIARQIAEVGVVLFGVVTITFIITRLLGTPVALLVGNTATEAGIRQARHTLWLDRPLYVQYLHYLGQLVRGNLGYSTHTFNPVTTDLSQRLPVTFELVAVAMLIAIVVGVGLGVASAVWQHRVPDVIGQAVAQTSMSIPSFWLGLILVYIFFVKLQVLPAPLGQIDDRVIAPHQYTGILVLDSVIAGNWSAFGSAVKHLLLPAVTLASVAIPATLQITRNTCIEVLKSDYIRTARAYGLSRRTVVGKYALRNIVAPVSTVVAMSFGYLMSGTVLIETVFAWPGIGLYAVDSLTSQDYQPIAALVVLSAVFYAASYLLADIISAIADPRIQIGG